MVNAENCSDISYINNPREAYKIFIDRLYERSKTKETIFLKNNHQIKFWITTCNY